MRDKGAIDFREYVWEVGETKTAYDISEIGELSFPNKFKPKMISKFWMNQEVMVAVS